MTDAHEGIPGFLKRTKPAKPLVYTFTMFSSYKNCPHQMSRRYIVKDQPYVETPEMAWGNRVHSAFEFRVGAQKPLPDGMQQWEKFATPFDGKGAKTEQKLGCTKDGKPCDFFADNVWFRGKIDINIVKGEQAFINDLKTGNSKYEDPFELETGAVLLKLHHRDIKVIKGNYTWLKEDRPGQIYDLSSFRKTWDEMYRLAGLIEADKEAGEFEKKKSGLCGWCSVSDCENHYVARK